MKYSAIFLKLLSRHNNCVWTFPHMALNVHIDIPLLRYVINFTHKKTHFLNFCIIGGTDGGCCLWERWEGKTKNNSKFLTSNCYKLLQISALWEMNISGLKKRTQTVFNIGHKQKTVTGCCEECSHTLCGHIIIYTNTYVYIYIYIDIKNRVQKGRHNKRGVVVHGGIGSLTIWRLTTRIWVVPQR